jgi:hypothetical protein
MQLNPVGYGDLFSLDHHNYVPLQAPKEEVNMVSIHYEPIMTPTITNLNPMPPPKTLATREIGIVNLQEQKYRGTKIS